MAHEFPRTVSRLTEMQSAEFLALSRRDVDTALDMTCGLARWWFLCLLCLAAAVALADGKTSARWLNGERHRSREGRGGSRVRRAVRGVPGPLCRHRLRGRGEAPAARSAGATAASGRCPWKMHSANERAAQRLAEVRDKVSAAQAQAQQREVVIREAHSAPAPAALAPAPEDAAASAPLHELQSGHPRPNPLNCQACCGLRTSDAERRAREADAQARTRIQEGHAAQSHREAVDALNAAASGQGQSAQLHCPTRPARPMR